MRDGRRWEETRVLYWIPNIVILRVREPVTLRGRPVTSRLRSPIVYRSGRTEGGTVRRRTSKSKVDGVRFRG